MNPIKNKFLITGDKSMSEIHLKQPRLMYSSCGLFIRNKERTKKFKGTGDSRYIYQNQLDKACFQYDMAHGDFKDLNRRTTADKVFRDKAFNISKNQKYDGYQCEIASMVFKFFDKKTFRGTVENKIKSNNELAEKLLKPIIRKFEKRKVHSPFIDNT